MDEHFLFDQPTVYQIRVKGILDPKWAEWFDGLELSFRDGDTLLTGLVADQSALHGLLEKINKLGLPLLSVSRLELSKSI